MILYSHFFCTRRHTFSLHAFFFIILNSLLHFFTVFEVVAYCSVKVWCWVHTTILKVFVHRLPK